MINNSANYNAIQYNLLIGSTNGSLVNLPPLSSIGIPLISNGSSVEPSFNTMGVAGGGTGATSFTPYSILCGGSTSTVALQTVSGAGSASQILTSNGPNVLPGWQNAPIASGNFQVAVQVFTSGTSIYTPTSGMVYCIIECVGGGGGGGGGVTASSSIAVGGGGGGGGYARKVVAAATIGSSQLVTIGTGGTGGAIAGTAGGTGGTSSVGSLVSASGGSGGEGQSVASTAKFSAGGAGGSGLSGDINAVGGAGIGGVGLYDGVSNRFITGGNGGYAYLGGGVRGLAINSSTASAGITGANYGGGGSGAGSNNSVARQGGNGAPGLVLITEYIT